MGRIVGHIIYLDLKSEKNQERMENVETQKIITKTRKNENTKLNVLKSICQSFRLRIKSYGGTSKGQMNVSFLILLIFVIQCKEFLSQDRDAMRFALCAMLLSCLLYSFIRSRFTVYRLLFTVFCFSQPYSRIDYHIKDIRDEGAGQHQHR
jgi:hypothetical protein